MSLANGSLGPEEVSALYARYGYFLRRRCGAILRDEALADDTLQEVFVNVMRRGAAIRSGVPQHPSAVFDLREAAPIVLTKTVGPTALVRFPQAADARYLVYAIGSRTVLGELWGSAERTVAFALPPGRYLVQRSGGAGSAGIEVSLSAGQARALAADEFRTIPEEQFAAKGGNVVLRPNEFGVELHAAASQLSTIGELVGLRYAYHWEGWALSLGVAAGRGQQRTNAENVTLASIGGDAIVERRWQLGRLGVGLGAGARADAIRQNLERTDAARVAAAATRRRSNSPAWPPARSSRRICAW